MQSQLSLAGCALVAALFSLPVFAQTAPAPTGVSQPNASAPAASPGAGAGMRERGPRGQKRDCAQSPNPENCKARQDAWKNAGEECKGKAGPEFRQCMHSKMPAPDCSKSPNPEGCKARQEARQKAVEECKSSVGREFRQCVRSKMPPPDCSKSANPQRCNNLLKAHAACKDKAGPDRRQCMQEQFKTK